MKLLNALRSGKFLVGAVIVVFAVAFFVKDQHWTSFASLVLLIVLLRLDDLKKLLLDKSGFTAEFIIPEEKLKQDIQENDETPTQENIIHFRQVEERVLADIQKNVGGEMKQQITFIYGQPDRPQFVYRPDATIQTQEKLIFVEIKYVLKSELAKDIVNNGARQLNEIVQTLRPSAGKPLSAKLVLVSAYDLSNIEFEIPEGIELEFYEPPSDLSK